MDKLKVLFVDDEEELVNAVLERLHFRGVGALGATDGEKALEIVRRERLDVVLLDVKMPGMDGLDLIKILKKEKPDLPVIFLTGHGSREDAEEGCRSGAYDYLMKPVDLEELLVLIHTAAQGRPPQEGAEESEEWEAGKSFAFVGRIVAEQSHEVTNVLNTMNEILGLTKDTIEGQLDTDSAIRQRLDVLLQRVDNQVRRGVHVARSVNGFAHTVEAGIASVDLGAVAAQAIEFQASKARAAKVVLQPDAEPASLEIRTVPILLFEAIHRCIDAGVRSMAGGGTLRVSHRATDEGAAVRIESDAGLPADPALSHARDRLRTLCRDLGGTLAACPGEGQNRAFELALPLRIPEGRASAPATPPTPGAGATR